MSRKQFDPQITSELVRAMLTGRITVALVAHWLRAGANPNAVISSGNTTLLMWVVDHYVDLALVKVLLENGASAAVTDERGVGIIDRFVRGYAFREVIGDGTEEHRAMLFSIMDLLLDHGASINEADEQGITPLMSYCERYSSLDFAEYLLVMGADVHRRDVLGYTPILFAAGPYADDTALISLLVEAGANVNDEAYDGNTALIAAVEQGDRATAFFLLEAGAYAVPTAPFDYLEPIFAVMVRDQERLDKAKRAGMRLDVRTRSFQTPLIWATAIGNKDAVQYLLANGVDAHARDKRGWTALFYAVDSGNEDICDLLLKHGARPNDCISGWTLEVTGRDPQSRDFNTLRWLLARNYRDENISSLQAICQMLVAQGATNEGIPDSHWIKAGLKRSA